MAHLVYVAQGKLESPGVQPFHNKVFSIPGLNKLAFVMHDVW